MKSNVITGHVTEQRVFVIILINYVVELTIP